MQTLTMQILAMQILQEEYITLILFYSRRKGTEMKKDIDTCFNYVDPKIAYFSSDEQKWINRIRKLKEQYPEEVHIIKQPEDNDGAIYCKLPTSWLKIAPDRHINMSDEQKTIASERLRAYRAAQKEKTES